MTACNEKQLIKTYNAAVRDQNRPRIKSALQKLIDHHLSCRKCAKSEGAE